MFSIPYQQTGYFSKLISDYLNQEHQLHTLYNRFPSIGAFKEQIEEKQRQFPEMNRTVLVQSLQHQYRNTPTSEQTAHHIALLSRENTFTIVTGHQLNLFTGPLYFLYKIISVINLCKELKKQYPAQHFVPVYWMATEDHDFDEINFFNFNRMKFQWNKEVSGPVGRLDTSGLDAVYEQFRQQLGIGKNAAYLDDLFRNAYLGHDNLADATRFLANELFGEYGLVIVDGDDTELKRLFVPHIKEELLNQSSVKAVEQSFPVLKDYTIQVNPREINLFYIEDGLRERIILENGNYRINHTDLSFSEEELLALLEKHPEKFSLNVILRPLYQEVILPNLCYIGGGGELAYWLELKEVFALHSTVFPILLLRNSALLVTHKQNSKREKLALSWEDLFLKTEAFLQKKTADLAQNLFDFDQQKRFLEEQFKQLEALSLKTHPSFTGAINAQKTKQLKGLENLEKRFLKAERLHNQDVIDRMLELKIALFPNNSLQERVDNFASFYLDFGKDLIPSLMKELDPLHQHYTIIAL